MDVNKELKCLCKLKKKKNWLGRVGVRLGGQSGCERRIEVFVKIQKKNIFFWGGGVGGGGESVGGSVGGRGRVGGSEWM